MILTSKQIIQEKLITGIDNPDCIQQVGIDLEICKVANVVGMGLVLATGKTILPGYENINSKELDENIAKLIGIESCRGWVLNPGYYEVTFKQGCKIPKNRTLKLKQRSSVGRSGAAIISGLYDPGFETKNIGAFLSVDRTIFIEEGARICQAYFYKSAKTDNAYKGQFQRDIQRSSEKQ
jgi:deoxycytidine triphosphate deaminase